MLSFKEGYSDIFNKLIERLKIQKIKTNGEFGKTFHHLLDCIVDHYFLAIATVEARLYQVDTELETRLSKKTYFKKRAEKSFNSFQVHNIRQQLHQLLHYTIPLNELILNLIQSDYFEEELRPYFNDIRITSSKLMTILKS